MDKKREEFQNKLIKEIEKAEYKPQMKTQRYSKQTIRENINQRQEDDKKKIIKLTPPPIDFKNK